MSETIFMNYSLQNVQDSIVYTRLFNPSYANIFCPSLFMFNNSFMPTTQFNAQPLFNFTNFNFSFQNTFCFSNKPVTNAVPPSRESKTAPPANAHYGAGDDVRNLYKGTAEDLNKLLSKYGVLAGKGAFFLEMQNKYGISAAFIASICIIESGGKAPNMLAVNNVTGMKPGGKLKQYSSIDACIDDTVNNIVNGKYYFKRGHYTISEIGPIYCNAGWSRKVAAQKQRFDNAVA